MIAQMYQIRKLCYTGGIPFSFGILFNTCSMLYDPKFQEDRVKIVLPRGYQSWAQFFAFGAMGLGAAQIDLDARGDVGNRRSHKFGRDATA